MQTLTNKKKTSNLENIYNMVKILTQELNLTRICQKKVFYNNTFNFLEFKSKKFYKKKHNSKNNFILNKKNTNVFLKNM